MATIMFYVKLAITGLTPSQLIERARAIIIALTGNINFTTPTPTLVALGDAADALEVAEAAVINNGGRQDHLIRNQREEELRDMITLLGSYVQVTSGGDPEKINSGGFQTRKSPTPVGLVSAPGNLRAEAGALPMTIDLRWDSVKGRLIYQAEICDGDPLLPENWKALTLLGRNAYRATGLTSHKAYTFRVRAIGAAGPGPLSDTATATPT